MYCIWGRKMKYDVYERKLYTPAESTGLNEDTIAEVSL
jgi:hypothetical protein